MAIIQSGASSDNLTIDPTSKGARASLYNPDGTTLAVAEGEKRQNYNGIIACGVNDGVAMGLRLDRSGSQAVALHTPLLNDSFEGTAINPTRWLITATTMAATQTTVAGVTFNSANIVTVNTGYMLTSARRLQKTQRGPLQLKMRARLERYNNSVMELGLGDAATFNGAHTTGAYWQVTAGGVVQPVLTFNGNETTGTDVSSLLNQAHYYTFDIVFDDDGVTFYIQNTATEEIISRQVLRLPATQQRLFSATSLPAFARLYNTAVAPATAPHMFLTDVYALSLDVNRNQPWSHGCAALDRGMTAQPYTGAQLAQWANSAAPANATLSNTAAGYGTLGGLFQFAAVAGAATDFALFGFQVPVGSNLFVTGIDIDVWNTGAASATTPTLLAWAAATGSTAASLVTATVGRVGLGAQVIPVGTPIGGMADRRVTKSFETPLFCASGRFLHIILRMPVGTATASQVIAGMVSVEGYFE